MRAVRIEVRGGPEVLNWVETAAPRPRPGEVLIEVKAAGVNFADVMQREGSYPQPTRLPLIPGLEVAGRVVEGGEAVGLSAGARVLAFVRAGYAELAVARAAGVVPLPEGLSDAEATAFAVQGATAKLVAEAAQVRAGEWVLLHAAAGGVGVLAVQLLKSMGAKVVATASTPEKRELARSLGAAVCVDYGRPGWVDEVKAATGGEGAQVVLEMVGGEVGRQSFGCLAPFGRMVVFGMATGKAAPVEPMELVFKNQRLIGVAITGYPTERLAAATGEMLRLWREGSVRPVLGGTFPMPEAARAHRALQERGSVGKLALVR